MATSFDLSEVTTGDLLEELYKRGLMELASHLSGGRELDSPPGGSTRIATVASQPQAPTERQQQPEPIRDERRARYRNELIAKLGRK